MKNFVFHIQAAKVGL